MNDPHEQTAALFVFPSHLSERDVVSLCIKIQKRLKSVTKLDVDDPQVMSFCPDYGSVTIYQP